MSDLTFHWPWRGGELAAAREALMKRSGGVCEHCGSAGRQFPGRRYPTLVVHHERYAEVGTPADLLLLCTSCHRKRHARDDAPQKPYTAPGSYPRCRRDRLVYDFSTCETRGEREARREAEFRARLAARREAAEVAS